MSPAAGGGGSGGSGPATGGTLTGGGGAAGGALAGGGTQGGSDPASGGAGAGSGGVAGGGGADGGSGAGGAAGLGGSGSLGPITVWIAGDSTVANGNTPCPVGWGKLFDAHFNDQVTVTNSAVGGRSVRTWLYNVTTEMDPSGECVLMTDGSGNPTLQARWQAMLDGMKSGDYLIIQFGINDGSATCDRHVGLDAFKESYAMMAEAAKARGTQPIFLTPVSSISCNGSTAVGSRGAFVTATKEAGAGDDVPVIDLHQLSVDLYQAHGFCPVSGGDVSASTTGPVGDFFCDDHTHFETQGATEIAALLAQALRDQGIGLSAYLVD